MKKLLPFRVAVLLSLILFGTMILFHLGVVAGIVIFNYVPVGFLWGGRMETREQLLWFELISLVISAICFFIILVRDKRIYLPFLMNLSRVIFWILSLFFLLNTIGNVLAKTTFEKSFAVLTAVLTLLGLRPGLEKSNEKTI